MREILLQPYRLTDILFLSRVIALTWYGSVAASLSIGFRTLHVLSLGKSTYSFMLMPDVQGRGTVLSLTFLDTDYVGRSWHEGRGLGRVWEGGLPIWLV